MADFEENIESITESGRALRVDGSGESIRTRPETRIPVLMSWRATSNPTIPPKDHPICRAMDQRLPRLLGEKDLTSDNASSFTCQLSND